MREGYYPNVTIFKDGQCNGLMFGSDCVSEHEWGIDDMQKKFCTEWISHEDRVTNYRESKGQQPVPKIETRFNKNLELIVFREVLEPTPVFMIQSINKYRLNNEDTYLDESFASLVKRMVSKTRFSLMDDKPNSNYYSMWDARNFLFVGAGVKEHKRVKTFYQAIQAGTVMVAPTGRAPMFTGHERTGGLILVDTARLDYSNKKVFEVEYEKIVKGVVLKANGKQTELMLMLREKGDFGSWIWPTQHGESIRYSINPGYEVNAQYGGQLTETQIRKWAESNFSYRLDNKSPGANDGT